MAGPLGGAGTEDPGAPTINVKKYRRRAPGRPPQGGALPIRDLGGVL
jgi:hypothetical protein